MNELLELTDDIATRELAPQAAAHEREARFPRQAFRTLGRHLEAEAAFAAAARALEGPSHPARPS